MSRLTIPAATTSTGLPVYSGSLQNLIAKLTEYEDAEAQGLLVRLPCKVGDIVFYVSSFYSRIIERHVVTGFCFYGDGCQIRCRNSKGEFSYFQTRFIGKTLFLTREEAERALPEAEVE